MNLPDSALPAASPEILTNDLRENRISTSWSVL